MTTKRFAVDGEVLIYRSAGDDLVPIDVVNALGAAARAGEWEGGVVRKAVVEFDSEPAARANTDRLAFAGVGARLGGVDVPPSARFAVRGDFGLE